MGETDTRSQDFLIITGMSGAGRSTVGNALEDLGFYVVDNLPPQMIAAVANLASRPDVQLPKMAAIIDVRGGKLFTELREIVEQIRSEDEVRVTIVFLDATDQVLVRRFEQVRRPHPLQGDGTLLDGIAAERARMLDIREQSDMIIDTSELNIHDLSRRIHQRFGEHDQAGLQLTVQSFGFKYGLPTDADMVVDARFIPNPFWQSELRPLTGRDKRVSDYVFDQPGVTEFVEGYTAALGPVLAGFERENKRHATLAIGCTGGKHRSVALTERIAQELAAVPGVSVSVKHRDLGRE